MHRRINGPEIVAMALERLAGKASDEEIEREAAKIQPGTKLTPKMIEIGRGKYEIRIRMMSGLPPKP